VGDTAFHVACREGDTPIVEMLYESVDPNQRESVINFKNKARERCVTAVMILLEWDVLPPQGMLP
jgi:ankyrin repeat protein